jgi:hypothetical protein
MKKNKKITKYFDNLARNYYHRNIKVDNDFFKFIASKINSSDIFCKSEYVKARSRLYKRISYFKKNKNIILLSESTGISLDDLLKLVISDDLKLTKTGIELFKRIYDLSVSAYKFKKSNELTPQNKKDNDTIILWDFLNYLKKQLQYQLRTDGRINVRVMPDGTIFYSNNAIYQALKTYFKNNRSIDIGSPVDAKRYMIKLVDQLRDADLLAKKINKGYYSNSFTVKDGDGAIRKEHGIFIKQ